MKKDIISALDSAYVIDGIRMDLTPRQILEAASAREEAGGGTEEEPVVDESADPMPYRTVCQSYI